MTDSIKESILKELTDSYGLMDAKAANLVKKYEDQIDEWLEDTESPEFNAGEILDEEGWDDDDDSEIDDNFEGDEIS